MGYGNRPTMPNNSYQKGNFNKNYGKQQFNKTGDFGSGFKKTGKATDSSFKKNNTFSSKDKDDIYEPKVYAKKPKEKSMFDDIVIPEYFEDKQRMRNKRANDKKYKNKNRKDY